jgi:hypothetical protein
MSLFVDNWMDMKQFRKGNSLVKDRTLICDRYPREGQNKTMRYKIGTILYDTGKNYREYGVIRRTKDYAYSHVKYYEIYWYKTKSIEQYSKEGLRELVLSDRFRVILEGKEEEKT